MSYLTGTSPASAAQFDATFLDVSDGTGNLSIPGNQFTTIIMATENADGGQNYDSATGLYTVPLPGIYDIGAKLRVKDGTAGGIGYGMGVHSANGDGPFFSWFTTQTNNDYARHGAFYGRKALFAAGVQLRLFAYGNQGLHFDSAAMTISLLRATT